MKINIQGITINDIKLLQEIGIQTFTEIFSSANSEENMAQYLKEGFSIEKLTGELNNYNSKFFFALDQERVIGYLKLNFGDTQTELMDANALEIERIYVLSEYQGKKVGQLLYDKAIEIAIQRKLDYIWLGVWEENKRALSFYKKNGFIEFDKHIFKLGEDEQMDIMMKLYLTK